MVRQHMKPLLLFSSLQILCIASGIAQATKGLKPVQLPDPASTGITRAVVVGISDYQNPGITDLQYAHRDAELFAEYLTNTATTAVKEEHLTLLTNAQATSGNVVAAMYGLVLDSKPGDRVIVYFSGHGDVETTTMQQPGFLLCWDAPAAVYMAGGTFPLIYLQDIISTLSVKRSVEVLVITDACRAGKLAGSGVDGTLATASAMARQYANEMKLLSCQPDELALEGPEWGEGRGVFSYYLLAGLQGLADADEDGSVTLKEIGRYLEDQVAASVAPHEQTPLIMGDKKTVLVKVDPQVKQQMQSEGIQKSIQRLKARNVSISADVFADSTDYDLYLAYQAAMQRGHYLYPEQGSAYAQYLLLKEVDELSPYVKIIERNLAAALQDEAQQAINDYLAASPEELRSRWNNDPKYQRYPRSLRLAADLLGKEHFFHSTLQARSLYFEGLVLRLAAEGSSNQDTLVRRAIGLQQESLELDSLSPHTLNELGVLHDYLGQYETSLDYHQSALTLSPSWILGKSNVAATYFSMQAYDKAVKVGGEIYEVDSTFLFNLNNLAAAHYAKGGTLQSIDYLHQAISIDSTYPKAHLTLAQVYSSIDSNTLAMRHYLLAEALKPRDVQLKVDIANFMLSTADSVVAKQYFESAFTLDPEHLSAIQGLIEYDYFTGNLTSAKFRLVSYLEDYPEDGFAHFVLASIYAHDKNEELCRAALSKAAKTKGLDVGAMVSTTSYFDLLLADESFQQFVDQLSDRK